MQYLKALLISSLALFLPIKPVLLAALFLCFADLIVGIVAAWKRGQRITSKGFSRTVVKVAVYEAAIISGFIVQKYLINDSLPLVNLVGGLIGVTEMKSVLENLDAIAGKSLFKSLIDRLGSQSQKGLDDK